ncbi:MAG: hypothetical protein KAV40_05290 [Thermoplasmatales archaeon]|nr:hypothetical protein [Thermoplasmatales archaeon]
MKKNENIHVKLQIGKDENSGELILNIRFDKDTPNFFTDKDVISWCPTIEEINFVNEAFEMISKRKSHKQKKMNEDKTDTHEEKKTDDHSKTSNEEKAIDSRHEKEGRDTEENPTLSDSEQKDVNEWPIS